MYLKKIAEIISIIFLISVNLFAQPKNTIAVLSLDAHGISGSEADVLATRLRSLLVNLAKYDVVDRSRMEDILKEQGFQQTGCTSDECLVEAGKLLGVQKMLAGSIGKFGTVYTLDLRIIDVETGRIESSSSYDYQGEMENLLTEGVETALRQLTGMINEKDLTAEQRRRLFGSLAVTSQPSEAFITLNGQKEGQTPRNFPFLPVGYHDLQVEKEGYLPVSERIKIEANQTSTIQIDLRFKYAYLGLRVDQAEAEVFINDQTVGKGGFIAEKIGPGQYTIEIKHPFYDPYREVIDLAAEDTIIKKIDLIPAFGYLIMEGKPENASVGILNEKHQDYYAMPQVKNLKLRAGFYDLEVEAPYYFPYRERIKIEGNEKLPLEINLDFGGDDLRRLRSQRKWLNIGSLAGIGLTAGSMLIANSMYTQYKNADRSSEAETYRQRTELFDHISLGLSAVTLGISVYSIWKWYTESRLKKELGLK